MNILVGQVFFIIEFSGVKRRVNFVIVWRVSIIHRRNIDF